MPWPTLGPGTACAFGRRSRRCTVCDTVNIDAIARPSCSKGRLTIDGSTIMTRHAATFADMAGFAANPIPFQEEFGRTTVRSCSSTLRNWRGTLARHRREQCLLAPVDPETPGLRAYQHSLWSRSSARFQFGGHLARRYEVAHGVTASSRRCPRALDCRADLSVLVLSQEAWCPDFTHGVIKTADTSEKGIGADRAWPHALAQCGRGTPHPAGQTAQCGNRFSAAPAARRRIAPES